MWRDANVWALVVFALVFVVSTFRRGRFAWLWGTVLLWSGFGLISAMVMPSVLGITHLANLYPLPAYAALAGLSVFLSDALDTSPPNGRFALRGIGTFLPLLAMSGLIVLAAFLLLCATFVALGRNEMLLLFGIGVLLDPLHWLAIQAILMGIMYAVRKACAQEVSLFSVSQSLFLLSLALVLILVGKVISVRQIMWIIYWLIYS